MTGLTLSERAGSESPFFFFRKGVFGEFDSTSSTFCPASGLIKLREQQTHYLKIGPRGLLELMLDMEICLKEKEELPVKLLESFSKV